MEDVTLALITLTSFVLLFVIAIFADRAGMQANNSLEKVLIPVDDDVVSASDAAAHTVIDADVA